MLDDCNTASGEALPGVTNVQTVMLLEDDGLLSMLLEEQLESLGVASVLTCPDLATAAATAEKADMDAAILDIYVHGRTTYAVADILAARRIPFMFCTGLGSEDLDARYRDRPVLIKPYGENELRAALATLTAK